MNLDALDVVWGVILFVLVPGGIGLWVQGARQAKEMRDEFQAAVSALRKQIGELREKMETRARDLERDVDRNYCSTATMREYRAEILGEIRKLEGQLSALQRMLMAHHVARHDEAGEATA